MPRPFDENDFTRLTAEQLRGVGCPDCGRAIIAWYGWKNRAMSLTCAGVNCLRNKYDGVAAPPWAKANSNTTLDTWSGKMVVEVIPRELTLQEIDGRRGTRKAMVRLDGWTTCPFCKVKFATTSETSWKAGRHVSCKTRLELVSDSAAPTPPR